jgi:hypothetical protein
MSLSNAWRLFAATKRSFIVSGMSHSRSSLTCPSSHPSLTPAVLAAFGIGPSRAPAGYGYDDDEEAGTDDEETEDDE